MGNVQAERDARIMRHMLGLLKAIERMCPEDRQHLGEAVAHLRGVLAVVEDYAKKR